MANFDVVKAIFSQVDTNNDRNIDSNEFRNWAAGASSSLSQSSTAGLDTSSNLAFSGSAGLTGTNGYQASYSTQSGVGSSNELAQTSGVSLESSSAEQSTQYASNNRIFNDPNPQVIRRAATGDPLIYQQKILVRFLQPPPLPPPGPLIIKEIRPMQPPPPPPLVLRQRAPPLLQPPPLILRERPPIPPTSVASQTVIRRLAALPVPPRSVITERLPPLPPRPRDIIIERWVPYGAQAKRRTIVQRAATAQEYAKPRNLIVIYDAVQARIVRQFQRLGVTQENPQAYLTRYGASLLEASTLVQQARAAGVVEDISPPVATANYQYSSSSAGEVSGFEGLQAVGGSDGNYSSQSYSSSSSSTYGIDGALANSTGFNLAAVDTNNATSSANSAFQYGL